MRILWLTVDRSHRIAHHFDDFRKTVSSLPEVEVATLTKRLAGDRGQNMWQLSRNLITDSLVPNNIVTDYLSNDPTFDFIFCDAFFAYLHEEWEDFNIPSAIFIEDVHQEVPRHQIKVAKEKGISTIFHRFNFGFHKFHPEARFDFICIWLPHSVRMERYIDTVSKSIDILHTGVYPEQFYPNRYYAVSALRSKPYFKIIQRPKDTPGESRHDKWPIDKDYDNLLQQARITITGGSIFNAPVQKYVEIPAANSLLLSNWFPDLGLMGFVPGTNMVTYCRENVVEVVEGLLNDKDEIARISNNGYNLILLNHTSEVRAKQFINFICDILLRQRPYITSQCSFQLNFDPNGIRTIEHTKAMPTIETNSNKPVAIVEGTDWRSRIRAGKLEEEGYLVQRG